MIDAPEAAPVIARVEKLGVRVTKVLSTHHHLDHSGANPELAKRYRVPVIGHASDSARIPGFTHGRRRRASACASAGSRPRSCSSRRIRAGTSPTCFPGAVFCGDTLFAGGCGRLFEGNPQMMHEALNVKLAKLPDATRVYCGHEYTEANLRFALTLEPGNAALRARMARVKARRARRSRATGTTRREAEMTVPSTLADERATNPFMRAHSPELVASVRKLAARKRPPTRSACSGRCAR